MKKSIVYVSIGATVLVMLASLSSVIGSTALQNQDKWNTSPLFAVRTARSNHEQATFNIQSNYLGKGINGYLFPSRFLTLQAQLDKAIKILYNNPILVKELVKKISDFPQVKNIFDDYKIQLSDVERYITQVRDNPEILKDQLKEINFALPLAGDPQPLGLDTSSAIGCFITVLVLLPLAITIGLLIATITLVTCLNLGNCLETVIAAILTGMLQELKQP